MATTTWTGASGVDNTLWSEVGNWDNGVPGVGDDAVLPAGVGNIYTAGPVAIKNLTILGYWTVELNGGDVIVAETITHSAGFLSSSNNVSAADYIFTGDGSAAYPTLTVSNTLTINDEVGGNQFSCNLVCGALVLQAGYLNLSGASTCTSFTCSGGYLLLDAASSLTCSGSVAVSGGDWTSCVGTIYLTGAAGSLQFSPTTLAPFAFDFGTSTRNLIGTLDGSDGLGGFLPLTHQGATLNGGTLAACHFTNTADPTVLLKAYTSVNSGTDNEGIDFTGPGGGDGGDGSGGDTGDTDDIAIITHIVKLAPMLIDSAGNILSSTYTIGQRLSAGTEVRIVTDTNIPNSINSPTLEAYLVAEDAAGFKLIQMTQNYLITQK